MIRAVRAVLDFIVGDDPLTAVGVAVAIGATAAVSRAGIVAWWIMPVAALLLLAHAVGRARDPGGR